MSKAKVTIYFLLQLFVPIMSVHEKSWDRANLGFTEMVSGALEAGAEMCEIQPGQGTVVGRK